MGTYPWGPHGPQSGPNQVTPNPTPSYVPPSSGGGDYYAPTSSSPAYGGWYGGGAAAAYSGPWRKSYILAIIFAVLFGPLGLFYTSKKGALIMLLFLIGVPVGLNAFMQYSNGSVISPFGILEHSVVMDPMLRITGGICVIWTVVAARRFNKALKASKAAG
jgi:hypothetical protein